MNLFRDNTKWIWKLYKKIGLDKTNWNWYRRRYTLQFIFKRHKPVTRFNFSIK